MKRVALALVGVLVGFACAQAGQESKSTGNDSFWGTLRTKMEKVTPTRKSTATTAVGGVRAAKNEDAAEIYWKGKEKRIDVGEDELEKFNQAVETRLKGDNVLALQQFEEFLRDYPKSSLKADGLQAIEKLKEEGAGKDAVVK